MKGEQKTLAYICGELTQGPHCSVDPCCSKYINFAGYSDVGWHGGGCYQQLGLCTTSSPS